MGLQNFLIFGGVFVFHGRGSACHDASNLQISRNMSLFHSKGVNITGHFRLFNSLKILEGGKFSMTGGQNTMALQTLNI